MKVHDGSSKFFRCEICNVNFLNKADHEGHRNSKHLNYKPFKCENVLKLFHLDHPIYVTKATVKVWIKPHVTNAHLYLDPKEPMTNTIKPNTDNKN